MSVDQMVAVFSALTSFAGLVFVALQMRDATRQRRQGSLSEIYDINRQLLSLGFDHPQLFAILVDKGCAEPEWERRYLQMWLNQLSLIYSTIKQGGFDPEFEQSLEWDIRFFMTLENMRRHWKRYREFYPASFQALVNGIVDGLEGPPTPPANS